MPENQLPIEHLSYSALKTYCSNPYAFLQQYILRLAKFKSTPSAVVGKGVHKVLQSYFDGMKLETAIEKGLEEIERNKDSSIDYGKTGSRQKIIETFHKTVEFIFAELPEVGEIVAAEKEIPPTFFHMPEGDLAPLPIKAITDLITRIDGKLWIWDWKTTVAFSDFEKERGDYTMQAMFNYFTVKETYKEAPVGMNYVEIKTTKNSDGGPQVQIYPIVFEECSHYFDLFYRIYTDFLMDLSSREVFLPNFSDNFTGKDTWDDFVNGAMDWEMPKQVKHMSPLNKNVREVKYVESTIHKTTAHDLTDQEKIASKFMELGLAVRPVDEHIGPNITLYTFAPGRAIPMSKFDKCEKDIALALKSKSVRIQAPIPGTDLIGVETANKKQYRVDWSRELLTEKSLILPIGSDVYGNAYKFDLAKAPHLLVAGTTGSGKSVGLNSFIHTLVEQNKPEDLGLILMDPKRTEFATFEDLPHLLSGEITTEIDEMYGVLSWAYEEMESRYKKLRNYKVKNIDEYRNIGQMKKIVIVIDEFASLTSHKQLGGEIERLIISLGQKSRACGIHLIIATQRPSVKVVSGEIKANFPCRISYAVPSRTDSMVILDEPGADQLLGNGDLLMMNPSEGIIRLQGYYVD